MSYEKQDGPPKVIRFYYGINDIFNKVSRKSSFKAASISKENEQTGFDSIQLFDDNEKIYMKELMKESLLHVFSLFDKVIVGNSLVHDTAFTPSGGSVTQASYADIKDNERSRSITLDFIDTMIDSAVVDFILSRWYALKGLGDDATIHSAEFNNYLSQISEKSIVLRQP